MAQRESDKNKLYDWRRCKFLDAAEEEGGRERCDINAGGGGGQKKSSSIATFFVGSSRESVCGLGGREKRRKRIILAYIREKEELERDKKNRAFARPPFWLRNVAWRGGVGFDKVTD